MISNKRWVLNHAAKLYDMCGLLAAFLLATFLLQSSPTGMSLSEFMALQDQARQLPALRTASSCLAQSFRSLRFLCFKKAHQTLRRDLWSIQGNRPCVSISTRDSKDTAHRDGHPPFCVDVLDY